jgi:hypothetical protein
MYVTPEASESEHGGGSTGVPEWQLRDWDDSPLLSYPLRVVKGPYSRRVLAD